MKNMKRKKGFGHGEKRGKYYHGEFKPRNPQKYRGTFPIIWRSRWERKFMNICDLNENIIQWGSESVVIQYFDPVKRKTRRYFTDFILKIKRGDQIVTQLIEIKPYKQTLKPTKTKGKKKSTLMYEEKTYATNQAKWEAAEFLCRKKGWEFIILTEKSLTI